MFFHIKDTLRRAKIHALQSPMLLRSILLVGSAIIGSSFASPKDNHNSVSNVAWSTTTKSGINLTVYDDDSYSLGIVNGDTWLISGKHGFHSNGVWYLVQSNTSSTPNSTCTTKTDTDCRGSDITYINSTTSATVCCDACSATPGCGAWTLTGNTENVPWANRCYLKTDCSGAQSYTGHTSGVLLPTTNKLVRISASPTSGSTAALGPFSGYEVNYSGGQTLFTIVFKFYPQVDSITFEHSFPNGANNLNVTSVINTTSSRMLNGEFSASTMPSTAFPVWLPAKTLDAATLGSATWAGRFASSVSSKNGGAAYAVSALCSYGAEGGPIVLWLNKDGTSIGTGDTLVLGPNSNFKGSIMGTSILGEGCAAGFNGYVRNAGAGTQSSILSVFSKNGITDAMHLWGSVLQTQYSTNKMNDPMSSQLTFWTDNGAYYDWYSYEPDITSKGVPQDVLGELFATFRNGTYGSMPLPVKHVMLDAYWMYNSRPDGNCKVNDSFWSLPIPRPSTLSSELGNVGVILYNGPQCASTTYADEWPLVNSLYWNQGWGEGVFSQIAGANSSAFYSSLFSSLSQYKMTGFTQDFLDFHHLLFPAFLEDPNGNDAWQAGQAQSALEAQMPIQYCMAEPADLLNSVRFNAVTNARASDDYGAGSGSSWRIASTSLLLSSIGLRASKDNFWSGSAQTDRGREPSPFLSGVVTALSHGPVGFSDKIFATDPGVLWPTINEIGTLLHASRPATWLDSQWSGSGPLASGDVRSTNSNISGFSYYSVLAVGLQQGVVASSLTQNDLWPLPLSNITYILWQFNNSACFMNGGQSNECISKLGGPVNQAMIPAPPCPDETTWELWNISPTLPNGITLFGEYSKYVAMSPDRFENLVIQDNKVCLDISGGPKEVVSISYMWQNLTIGVSEITLDTNGLSTFCLTS